MAIQIFTTGGTFDKVYFDALSEFQIGEPMAGAILEEAGVGFSYHVQSLLKKDSLEITDADRAAIVEAVKACEAAHIVLIHGTDTMTLTAQALSGITGKTIVLTGAMQPARMHVTDARFNLGLAIGAVQSLSHGVYIAMSGQVFAAGAVVKNRQQGRFEAR